MAQSKLRTKLESKLKNIIKSIDNLPLKPEIYGYGSFFREKTNYNDINLAIKFTQKDFERLKRFKNFFSDGNSYLGNEKVNDFHQFMLELKEMVDIGNKKINFQKYCDLHPELKESIISKYSLDYDLLYYCNWSEITNKVSKGKTIPNIEDYEFFKRMFSKGKRGFNLVLKDSKISDIKFYKNYILLWSVEYPIFDVNLEKWENEKDFYIFKEFLHLYEYFNLSIEKFEETMNKYNQYLLNEDQDVFGIDDKEEYDEYEGDMEEISKITENVRAEFAILDQFKQSNFKDIITIFDTTIHIRNQLNELYELQRITQNKDKEIKKSKNGKNPDKSDLFFETKIKDLEAKLDSQLKKEYDMVKEVRNQSEIYKEYSNYCNQLIETQKRIKEILSKSSLSKLKWWF